MMLFIGYYNQGSDFITKNGILSQLNDLFGRVIGSNSTASAQTITAAQIINGIMNRTGSQGAGFNDTTDTAGAILGALSPNVPAGWLGVFRYINNGTGQTATLVGGTGVTVTGTATIANNAWRDFQINVTASPYQGNTAAVTFTNIGSGTI